MTTAMLAQAADSPKGSVALLLVPVGAALLLLLFAVVFYVQRYRPARPNHALVVYGKVGNGRAAICHIGRGALVWPLIQDSAYLSLEPFDVEIPLPPASRAGGGASIALTLRVSDIPERTERAAEHFLGLTASQVREAAQGLLQERLAGVLKEARRSGAEPDPGGVHRRLRAETEAGARAVGLDLVKFEHHNAVQGNTMAAAGA